MTSPLALPTTQRLTTTLRRGLLAGAVGTTVLNAVTYTDMAVRGRDASSTPEKTVEALTALAGTQVPGDRDQRPNRTTALGALLGAVSGLAAGVASALVRRSGVRLPFPLEAGLAGATAMALTDGPMAALGVSNPQEWSAADWVSDVVPHLTYGLGTVAALRSLRPGEVPLKRAGAGLIGRSLLLGIATGARSSLGVGLTTLTSGPTADDPDAGSGRLARIAAVTGIATELVVDKRPATPERTSSAGLPARFSAASSGALALARRQSANAAVPAVAALVGAAAGSWGGLAWRRWADGRIPDWQAALLEDAVALSLGVGACRTGRWSDETDTAR
jgi:uncharacterized membrane protein